MSEGAVVRVHHILALPRGWHKKDLTRTRKSSSEHECFDPFKDGSMTHPLHEHNVCFIEIRRSPSASQKACRKWVFDPLQDHRTVSKQLQKLYLLIPIIPHTSEILQFPQHGLSTRLNGREVKMCRLRIAGAISHQVLPVTEQHSQRERSSEQN